MVVSSEAQVAESLRRIQILQAITIVWMVAEAGVSLVAAWRAGSPALLAFGGDSAIELFSAVIVLLRFRARSSSEQAEKRTARAAGALLFVLAAYVAVVSVMKLLGHGELRTSYLGIGILLAASVVMPWLAREKRRLSVATGSATLRADAAQSGICAYLSLIALLGVAANAIWHFPWADPLAALAIVPLILWEGKEALRGRPCECV